MDKVATQKQTDGQTVETKYTFEEAYEATKEYFFGNDLAANVWCDKYAMRDKEGFFLEKTPDAMHDRLAAEFARIDSEKYGLNYDTRLTLYRDAMDHFGKVVPQGSPMAAVGNTQQIMSASNCVVVEPPHDSIAGIMKTGSELAQLFKRRCGVGTDLSGLRPDGFHVNNAARTTSGAWSFADYYSYITRMIGQCLHEDTQVLTRKGLKKIKTVTVTDEVWTKKGWVKVSGVVENQKPCVKVTTKFGHEIVCSEDHVFHTINGEKAIKDLAVGDLITQIVGENGWEGQDIPLIEPIIKRISVNKSSRLNTNINFPKLLDEKLAYIIGYSYGDGSVYYNKTAHKYELSLALDPAWNDIIIKIKQYLLDTLEYKKEETPGDGCKRIRIASKLIIDYFRANNFLKQKSEAIIFPTQLLKAKSSIIFAFISGYFDADGDVSKKKSYRFRSVRREFLAEIQNVLFAHGIPSKIHTQERKEENWRTIYTLSINGGLAQTNFRKFMKESVKIASYPAFEKIRDFTRTAYQTKDFDTRASKHKYIIDDRQWITYSTSRRLCADLNLEPNYYLLQDEITYIELYDSSKLQKVYDLILPNEHLFFANGLYAHNCGRRGALMVTLNVHHPDVEKFAKMKADLKKVTGGNVSIRLSDEFLQAVEDGTTYEQYWPCEDNVEPIWTKQVDAKQVWNTIIETATATAEPGLIFWNKITKRLPAHSYPQFKTRSTNPCCFAKEREVIVTTKEGLKEIKAITSKDEVWIDSEKSWAKTSGYFDAGTHPTYTVTFDNCSELVITPNHKLEHTHKGLVELRSLDTGDRINLDRSLGPSQTALITNIEYFGDVPVGCIEVENYHKFTANGIISGNSEIALSAYDSCRLISLNLTGFIRDAFTRKANFHWESFTEHVHLAMQMIDNLVDIELELIKKIQAVCSTDDERELWQKLWQAGHDGRRTGLGTHGLADMLAQLGIKYDSQEALEFADDLYETLRNNSYMASIELAEKRGAFPAFDWEVEKDNEYIQDLPDELKDRMAKTGRRNISILTQAPTGSVSIISKCGEFNRHNISSGVEPVFRNWFTRRKKINAGDIHTRVDYTDALGDNWQNFEVYHGNILNYFEKMHGADLSDLTDNTTQEELTELMKELPDHFVTSDQVDWKFRVDLQGHSQHFLDHSISSTINLPKGTTSDVVGDIYLSGWRAGLKGVTVYVDGSRDGVLITKEDDKIDPNVRPEKIVRLQSPKRPKEMPCDIHQHQVRGEKWTALVGLLHGEPYEMFGGYSNAIHLPKKYTKGILKRRARGKYDLIIPVGDGEELVIRDVVGHQFSHRTII